MTPSASTTTVPSVKRIRHRLALLRVRMRAIVMTIAGSRWLIAAIATLGVYFAADWFLDLPLGVRRFARLGLIDAPGGMSPVVWLPLLLICGALAVVLTRARRAMAPVFAFLAAGVLGLLAWLAVRAFRPLGHRLRDADLALTFERRFQHLQDRLASALDFERELGAPQRGESPEMMRAVVTEAVEEAQQLSVIQAAPARRARQWSAGALGAIAAVVLVAVTMPDAAGLWVRRSLLLEDVAWPQETSLIAVIRTDDGRIEPIEPGTPIEVPQGRPFTVVALAEGVVPAEAFLVDVVAGQQPLPRRMFRVADRENLFSYEFRDVRRDFRFTLRGGDDRDDLPIYDVRVVVPPRVLGMRTRIEPPAYLGLPPEELPSGSFTAPEGSQVEVAFRTDIPVAGAQIVFGDETLTAVPVQEGENGATDGRAFRFSLLATKGGSYRILLRTPNGRTNDGSGDTYEVRIERDRAPQVMWTWPRGTVQAAPDGRLPLLGRAIDDHSVARLFLEVRTDAEHSIWYDLRPADGSTDTNDIRSIELDEALKGARRLATTDRALGEKEIRSYLPLELNSLRTKDGEKLRAGTRVLLRLIAYDSRGQRREGEWSNIDLYSRSELERDLVGRRISVRGEIETVQSEQQIRLEELKGLADLTNAEERASTLKTLRFAQSKITQDSDRAMRGLGRVFDAFVLNRLGGEGAEQPTARILSIYDTYHRNSYGVAPETESEEGRARTGGLWKGDPVFPYALYKRITTAWRNKAFVEVGLLDRMLVVLEDAALIGSQLAPEAQVAAARAVTGTPEDIEAARVALEAHAKALTRLLDSMSSWKGLQDVVLAVRARAEEQREIARGITSTDANETEDESDPDEDR